MNIQEAQKIYKQLEETQEENIACVVSTSKIQGDGIIYDAQDYYKPIFLIKMDTGIKVEIPCFRVERKG